MCFDDFEAVSPNISINRRPPGQQGALQLMGLLYYRLRPQALALACEIFTARSLKRERRASPAVTTLINLDFNDPNLPCRRDDARQQWRSPLAAASHRFILRFQGRKSLAGAAGARLPAEAAFQRGGLAGWSCLTL